MRIMKEYLNLKFHDNDFMHPMMDALKALYEYAGCQSSMTQAQLIRSLHEENKLVDILRKLIIIECIKREVGDDVRFFGSTWHSMGKPIPEIYSRYAHYFDDIKISFHNDTTFSHEWMNSECYGLDLYDGYVWSY